MPSLFLFSARQQSAAPDEGYRGIVISLAAACAHCDFDGHVKAGAAVALPWLARNTRGAVYGLEFAAGIRERWAAPCL